MPALSEVHNRGIASAGVGRRGRHHQLRDKLTRSAAFRAIADGQELEALECSQTPRVHAYLD